MNRKVFGKTGASVSEIGMGTYYDPLWIARATLGWRRGAATKIEALQAGLEGGINLIDTAEIYRSEPLVARAIEGRKREELFIATKVWPNHLHRDALVAALDRSLRHLRLSYVDLYQIHFYSSRIPLSETMAAMEQLKEQGKIRSIGVSNFSAEQVTEANAALKKSEVVSNQVDYSLADRSIEADLLPFCERNGIVVLAYYPLAHGKLANAGQEMREVCQTYGKTPAQVALNWLASKPNVIPIPRASRATHVKENLGASGWELSQDDKKRLEGIFR
jgi:diketogulonate reductase-like aldo/keto reductase